MIEFPLYAYTSTIFRPIYSVLSCRCQRTHYNIRLNPNKKHSWESFFYIVAPLNCRFCTCCSLLFCSPGVCGGSLLKLPPTPPQICMVVFLHPFSPWRQNLFQPANHRHFEVSLSALALIDVHVNDPLQYRSVWGQRQKVVFYALPNLMMGYR